MHAQSSNGAKRMFTHAEEENILIWKAIVMSKIYQLAVGHYSPHYRILYIEIKRIKKKVFKTKINEYKIILRLMKTLIGKLFSNTLFREL